MTETAKPTPGLQKTLADFKPPFSAKIIDTREGPLFSLSHKSDCGVFVTQFPLKPGHESDAITEAWNWAYPEATLDSLREVNAELLRALQELRDYAAERILQGGAHHDPIWARVATILENAKAEGRT